MEPKNIQADAEARDRKRLRAYKQIVSALGLDLKSVDSMGPDEIKTFIRSLSAQRTEEQICFEQPIITVSLAGKQYEIPPLKMDVEIRYRRKLGEVAGKLLNPFLDKAEVKGGGKVDVDLQSLMTSIMPMIFGELLDDACELMFMATPEITADKEKILKEATAAEITKAAMGVFRQDFPFVLVLLRELMEMASAAGMMTG